MFIPHLLHIIDIIVYQDERENLKLFDKIKYTQIEPVRIE